MGCATCHWNEFSNSKIRDKKLRERFVYFVVEKIIHVVSHFSIPLMVAYDGFFVNTSTSLKPARSSMLFNCSGG